MSVVLMDGFDHYNAAIQKYPSSSVLSGTAAIDATGALAAFGYGQALRCYGGGAVFQPDLPTNYTTLIWNGHYYVTAPLYGSGVGPCILFTDAGNNQCEVYVETNGIYFRFSLRRNGTLLATGSYSYIAGVHYWLSIKLVVDGSSGLFELKVNGSTAVTYSGNTKGYGSSGNVNRILHGWPNSGAIQAIIFDNVVVCDTSGTWANDYLPESRIYYQMPTANDAVQFTPSSGANWQRVLTIPPPGDSSYNYDPNVGDQDTFAAAPSLGTATILALQVTTNARKDDAGNRSMRNVIKSGSGTYDNGADIALSNAYQGYRWLSITDPDTAAQWAAAAASAAKIGYKVAA